MIDAAQNDSSEKAAPSRGGLFSRRSWSRRLAMQALYQWQMAQTDISQITQQYTADENFSKADAEYFEELVHSSLAIRNELDGVISQYLDRPLNQLDPIEQAILWLGTYELTRRRDVPYRVTINESVELAKKFGAEQGHKFINGILDKIARSQHPESDN